MTAPAISKKTWLGLALETTPGTAVTTPTRYIPCKSDMKGLRKPEYSDDDRGSRDKNFQVVYGQREGSLSLKGDWFNDACVPLLYGAMGGIASTQPDATNNPTVYRHNLSMADVPPTFTFVKEYIAKRFYLSYGAVEKFSLKFSGASKAVDYDASIKCRYPLPHTTVVTPAFTTVRQFSGANAVLSLTSLGSSTTDILDFDIEISQKIEIWQPASGQFDYVGLYFGEREVKLGFTARFDLPTVWNQFDTITDDSVTITLQGDLISNGGGTSYYQTLLLNAPLINYDSVDPDLGKTNVLVKAKATARPKADLSQAVLNGYAINTVTNYTNG